MRTRLILTLLFAGAAWLLLTLRTAERPEGAPAAAVAPEEGPAWPCTAYSAETRIEGATVAWSYRLCGRGTTDRRIEVRFRNPGAAADSIAYRLWLAQPVDCATRPWSGPRTVLLRAGTDTVTEALAVSFAAYRGELWLCGQRAGPGGGPVPSPRRARHGDAI